MVALDMLPLSILLLQTVISWFFIFSLYRFRKKITLIPFYTYLATSTLLAQNLVDLGFTVTAGPLSFLVGSVAFFTTMMLGILILYLFEGPRAARLGLEVIVGVTLFYILIVWLLGLEVNSSGWVKLSLENFVFYFWSLVAIMLDVFFMAIVWELLSKKIKLPTFVNTFVVILAVFVLDTVIFTTGVFGLKADYLSILSGNLMSRFILTIIMTPIVGFYLKIYGYSEASRKKPEKIWEILDFRSDLETKIRSMEELMRREEDLVGELNKFKLAVDGASNHIVITDAEGKIVYANKGMENITGFSREEVMNKKAGSPDLWGGLMPKVFYEKMWKTIKIDKLPFSGEIINRRKNGDKYVALATISPILDREGKVIYFVGIERDITKEKEVDRMKTEFVSLVTHQLRTPITAVKWSLEMLAKGELGALTGQQKEILNNAMESNEHMEELVMALLNISRIESGRIKIEPKPTNLRKMAEEIVKELEPMVAEKKVNIEVGVEFEEEINLDSGLIREAIKNLLTNALKYSDRGKTVEFKVSKKEDEVEIRVTDTGMGIPKGEQTQIFEKFFRASNAQSVIEGTGLGLYLTKQIVTASGGKIGFESEEGKGTTFWFTLPVRGVAAKEGEVTLN